MSNARSLTDSDDKESRYRGKRCICLARQSSDVEGTTSVEAQLTWMHAEAERLGMTVVGDIRSEGMTGSLPGSRKDLEDLFRRKEEHDDFDVIMVQRLDRLTRGGIEHGFAIIYEAQRLGIELYNLEDAGSQGGPYSALINAMMFQGAKEQARSIGERSVQGRVYALDNGCNCASSRTPYGCDRLYSNGEGKPLHVIRDLGDGRQQKLHFETGQLIDTYGAPGGGVKGHYRKQKKEGVQLIPGAPERTGVVLKIFDLHYNQGQGGKRIADVLNRSGVLSPTGQGWSQRQVESIYENPVYTGYALGRRVSQGIYYRQGKNGPEKVNLTDQERTNCRSAPRKLRPPEDWFWQEQPKMKAFLPPAVAAKARAEIESLQKMRYQRSQDPTYPKRSPDKHKASKYILTGLLVAKQDGASLTGVLCGRRNHSVRYYRHRRGQLGYLKGSIYNRMIPAEPLERAVLELVRDLITKDPLLTERIASAVKTVPSDLPTEMELAELRRRRQEVARRTQLIASTFDDASLADAQPVLDKLGCERDDLDQRIAAAERRRQYLDGDPDTLAHDAVERLTQGIQSLNDLPPLALRDFLGSVVEKLEIDMETKAVEVSLVMPHWALTGDDAVRLAHSLQSPTRRETHQLNPISIGRAICQYLLKSSRSMFCCRRKKPAA